MLLARADEVIE